MPFLDPARRVFAGFFIYAVTMGSIFPRLPEIRDAMGIGEAALGLGLIGAPVGTFTALTTATPLIERIGFRRALPVLIPLIALFYAIAVHAPSPVWLFLLLMPCGFMIGCTEIILNVEADRTEAVVGRRIMNRSHAFWSIGFFSAGLFGAGMAQLGLSPQVHLALIVPIAVAVVAVTLRDYHPSPTRTVEVPGPRFAWPSRNILVLVGITMSAVLMEGAGIDWSAIYMTDLFGAAPFVAGLAVAAVAGAQALVRFVSDGFVDRYSPATVARTQLLVMAVGLVLLVVAVSPSVSLLGFLLTGAGCAAMFPLAISAAAQMTDRPSATNVAAFAQTAFTAFMVGPPLLGFVAQHVGIQWVYGVGLPLVGLSLLLVNALGTTRRAVAA